MPHSVQVRCERCTHPFNVEGKNAKNRARLTRFCAGCKKLNNTEAFFRYRMRTSKGRLDKGHPKRKKKPKALAEMDAGISASRLVDMLIRESVS